MKATIRKRKRANGFTVLYVDIVHANERIRKTLPGLKLFTHPRDPHERQHNKQVMARAERERVLMEYEGWEGAEQFRDRKGYQHFNELLEELAEKRTGAKATQSNWFSAIIAVEQFDGKSVAFGKLNTHWLSGFKEFLDRDFRTKRGSKPSASTKQSYFSKVRRGAKEAFKLGLIKEDVSHWVPGFPNPDTPHREFLTVKELQKLSQTPFDNTELRNAFFLSAYTGLRWSDVSTLTWEDFQHSEETGYFVRIEIQKTKRPLTIYVPDHALRLFTRGERTGKLFPTLKYSSYVSLRLKQWCVAAGIPKDITFHSARHSYAVLQLSRGISPYHVKELLGHKHLRTTEMYLQVMSSELKEAAHSLPAFT